MSSAPSGQGRVSRGRQYQRSYGLVVTADLGRIIDIVRR
jgi:hypothetical protein